MLHALKAAGSSLELHYSARQMSDLAFRQDIERLIGDRAHFYASQEPGQKTLDLEQVLAEPLPGTHVYVCGPRPMIVAVRDLAQEKGWPRENIHFESFGSAVPP